MCGEDENLIMLSHGKLQSFLRESSGCSEEEKVRRYLKSIDYPPVTDFKKGLEWFNVSEALSFKNHLKGKVVLLDFFTYCCINCMHILPDLHALEEQFTIEDGLVIVGVHSAKFDNERDSGNVLSAVQRYNIKHPVVNDKGTDMWAQCEVHCWPTLLLVGPQGRPIVMFTGEGHKEELFLVVSNVLNIYKHQISKHSLPIQSSKHLLPESLLCFPGKVACFDEAERTLVAISDSGNHRILVVVDNCIVRTIGAGTTGYRDGTTEECQFNQPQGVVFLNESILYVADTENHAIREVDLLKNRVTTVAGTGKQCDDKIGGKTGPLQGISSPWDVCLYQNELGKRILLIAMAGTHQIWALFLDDATQWWKGKVYAKGTCVAIAGSGREENRNNQYPLNAAFAQPSGIALSRKRNEVFIADSESSSVRKLSLIDGKVSAVAGGDRNPSNLFAFGDLDGTQTAAKFQHPLGLAVSHDEEFLFVADTYNHKLKRINVDGNRVSTVQLTTSLTIDDGKLRNNLNEPSGLCQDRQGNLYVADTNNHQIKIVSLADVGDGVNSVVVGEVRLLALEMSSSSAPAGVSLKYDKPLGFREKITLTFKFQLDDLAWTHDAPQKWTAKSKNKLWSLAPAQGKSVNNLAIVITSSDKNYGREEVIVAFDLALCQKDVCSLRKFNLSIPLVEEPNGKAGSYEIKLKLTSNRTEII